jgi:hypothetical protein
MAKILLILGFISFRILCFSQNYDAELILQQTNIEINNNKLTKDLHFEIKIYNRAGEKYTKITIPYSKLNKLINIEAYIKESNGRIVKKLKKSEIVERSSISNFSFYEDEFVKEFTLKHNSYPYTIVYSYQITQNEFLYIDYWTPIIDAKIPTAKAYLNLSIPKKYKISFTNQFVNSPKIDSTDYSVNFHWHTSYTDMVKPEIYTPSIFKFLPYVAIVPQEFNFEKRGSFKDWNSYGNWQQKLLQGLNELPDNEKSKILSLIKNVEEDKEKIKILYHYLQDVTRYINVTIETGGLKPYPAIYVAQNKYGDCKALTNYFKSILDYIQIPSYYTKVHAGSPIIEIDKNFPSQQFNHVILYIRLKDEDIWLDCTSDGAFNYLGTFTQNRDAFIIDYDNNNFIKTPALKPEDVLETRKIEVNYNLRDANVKFQNTYKGSIYENILHLERNYNESEKSIILRNYFVDEGFDLLDYQVSKLDRDSVMIKLSYKATSQQIYKHYGNDILISNIAFSIPHFEKPTVRKLPIQIDYPIFKIDTLVYDIPIGYKLSKNIFNESVSNRFGQYKFDIYENQGKILVIKSLLINAGNYPISEYEDFYSFYMQIVEEENKTHLSLNK